MIKLCKTNFWLGFTTAICISGFNQDRHGSKQAYIEYIQNMSESSLSWIQVPIWIWVIFFMISIGLSWWVDNEVEKGTK
jgi:hypothetical protein